MDPKRLSQDQRRVLARSVQELETLAVSAATLVELAMLSDAKPFRIKHSADQIFDALERDPVFEILPITVNIAKEASYLTNSLRDPGDCVIVATARVHGLRLLTSDVRIVQANLVSTID